MSAAKSATVSLEDTECIGREYTASVLARLVEKSLTAEREAVWVRFLGRGPIPRVLKKGHAFVLAENSPARPSRALSDIVSRGDY